MSAAVEIDSLAGSGQRHALPVHPLLQSLEVRTPVKVRIDEIPGAVPGTANEDVEEGERIRVDASECHQPKGDEAAQHVAPDRRPGGAEFQSRGGSHQQD
jgi:hypothetical protein